MGHVAHQVDYQFKYIQGCPSEGKQEGGFKIYILQEKDAERFALGSVFWEVRRFFDRLLINTPLARWWTVVQYHRFKPICELMGVQTEGMRPSLKSEQAKLAYAQGALQSDGGLHLTEWVCSTHMLLLCLVDWHRHCRNSLARSASDKMLAEVLDHGLGSARQAVLAAHGCPSAEDRSKQCPAEEAIGSCCHLRAAQSCVHHKGEAGWCLLQEVFQELFCLGLQCPVVRSWFTRLLSATALAVDEAVMNSSSSWLQASPENVAHPRGTKRRRRMDPGLVQFAAKDVLKDKRFRSAAKAAKGLGLGARQTAEAMEETYMANYFASTHKHFHNRPFLFISTDAGRVGGEDTLFTVCWNMQANMAAWLVPQVPMG